MSFVPKDLRLYPEHSPEGSGEMTVVSVCIRPLQRLQESCSSSAPQIAKMIGGYQG